MVMLGPMKLIGPFVKLSGGLGESASRKLATRAFFIACVAGVAAAFIGRLMLEKWQISLPALLLTAGIVLLLIALQSVLAPFSHRHEAAAAPAPAETPRPSDAALKRLAFSPLAFPDIITPYGTAALILLATADFGDVGIFRVVGIFLLVMILNLLAMFYARPILTHVAGALTLLGEVLSVLQVALAVQMLLIAGRMLHILP